ncbi:hypothetical protein D3C85_1863140 [compost metagenome]
MQNCCVSKVEDIMEPVAIIIGNVVSQRVSNKHPLPLEITLAASSLIYPYPEVPRKLLFDPKLTVEIKAS